MSEIRIIGLSGHGPTPAQLELLQGSSLVVAGERLARTIADLRLPVHPITPLQMAIEAMAVAPGAVSVLASGDPLFFGIARRIVDHFGPGRVRIYPALSSIQEAAALFKMPWDDAAFVSLHGRREAHPAGRLLRHPKTLVLTDRDNSPDYLAGRILTYLRSIGDTAMEEQCRLLVAENIGGEDERVTAGSPAAIAGQHFSDLNVLGILVPEPPAATAFGLTEAEIHHSRGLITKDEIRAVTLHKLRLPRTGVFWDIGGGSGSISIEAAAINPQLTIYTVERKNEALDNIRANIRRFRCFNILPVAGSAAHTLHTLPDPDAVFIGGSGGDLAPIITEAAARLSPCGRLVINGVTEKTIAAAPQLMRDNGLSVEMTRLAITRMGADSPQHFNPITIMVGHK